MIRPLRVWHRRIFVVLLALPPLVVVALAARPDPQFWARPALAEAKPGMHAHWRNATQFELRAAPPLNAPDLLVYVRAADGTLQFVGSFDGAYGCYTAARGEVHIISGVDRATLAVIAAEASR